MVKAADGDVSLLENWLSDYSKLRLLISEQEGINDRLAGIDQLQENKNNNAKRIKKLRIGLKI